MKLKIITLAIISFIALSLQGNTPIKLATLKDGSLVEAALVKRAIALLKTIAPQETLVSAMPDDEAEALEVLYDTAVHKTMYPNDSTARFLTERQELFSPTLSKEYYKTLQRLQLVDQQGLTLPFAHIIVNSISIKDKGTGNNKATLDASSRVRIQNPLQSEHESEASSFKRWIYWQK